MIGLFVIILLMLAATVVVPLVLLALTVWLVAAIAVSVVQSILSIRIETPHED